MIAKSKSISVTSQYSFKYALAIEVVKKEWEKVNGSNVYLQIAYLKALEKTLQHNIQFVYAVVYKKNKPVGVLYFQKINIESSFFYQQKVPKQIHTSLTSRLVKKSTGALLLCGNFFATGANGFHFMHLKDEIYVPKVIAKLQKETTIHKGSSSLKFAMMKDFWLQEHVELQQKIHPKHANFKVDANMVLTIDKNWNSLEDYLNCMTTKYRTKAKSVFKKTKKILVCNFSSEDIAKHQHKIGELYNAVLTTARFNMVRLTANSFYELKKSLKDAFVFTAYFYENQLIAFSTACKNNNYIDANYVGVDYKINQHIPVYQKVLYDYVKLAILNKSLELRLGRTANTIKSNLGAVPKPMNIYVKHKNPILNLVLKSISQHVHPTAAPIREPFKKSYYLSLKAEK